LSAGALWQDHDLVFASAIGAPLDRHSVLRDFRKITAAAGLGTDWVPREMRHTCVSLLSSDGGSAGAGRGVFGKISGKNAAIQQR